MSGLFNSLENSVKALTAHSRSIETAGRNLANVNNASYARQRVVYGDRGTIETPQGVESLGIEAVAIEQLRDLQLDRQVMQEIALQSSYTAEQNAYQRAQAGLGQSIDRSQSASTASSAGTNGISAAIDDFFNAFQSFATTPTDPGERQILLQKSAILTDRFRLADSRLTQVQTDLDAQVTTDVTTTNALLTTIAGLNSQIQRLEATRPGAAVDLRDQREARLEELAAKIPIQVSETATGEINVTSKNTLGVAVPLITLSVVQGTVAYTAGTITAGSPAATLGLTGGGTINGAITARFGAVKTIRDNLDSLANQFVTSVNAAYNPLGTTGNFFTPTGTTAATFAIASSVTAANLKATDTGGAAGDNTIALAVAQVATQVFVTPTNSIDGTLSGFFSKSVSGLGQALSGANARVSDQDNIAKLVRTQRDGLSGVSLDEEMADLMKYQRAFQASSRVFSLIDGLLETVVNLGR